MEHKKPEVLMSAADIHQYYMDIINCMPNIVYWVDENCVLKGCNLNFVKLLHLNHIQDFSGTPYDLMIKQLNWPKDRIDSLKLDDMAIIFSGIAQHDVRLLPIQNDKEESFHFSVTRVPLLNAKKQVMGLVVILKDIASLTAPQYEVAEPAVAYRYDSFTKPLRVLVVEDNVIAQQVEQALLEGLNCQVDIAKSGDAAIELFQPGKYDIVFMDIGLEDTTGYIVSKSLRDIEKNTGLKVPIIALTSYEADIVKYDCDDYFMDGVITKPMSCEQAMQIIKHFVYHENVAIDGLGLVN